MKREKTITGVMLTEHDARIAFVEITAAPQRILLKALERIPLGEGESIDARLADLGTKLSAMGCDRHSPMWVACSPGNLSFASVTTEIMDIEKVGSVAWLKFKKDVENLPDKVVFDFEINEEEKDAVVPMWTLPAFAAPYEELAAIERWFAARFKLRGITLDLFACRNLQALTDTGDETVALLSCREDTSRIMYVKKGRTVFTRTIKRGFGTMLDHIERELEHSVDPETVEEILNMSEEEFTLCVNPDKARILAACTAGVSHLFTQVARTLDYYSDHLKNERPVKLYLTGDIDLLKRFIPGLCEQLMLPVELIDPAQAGIELSAAAAARIEGDGAEHYAAAIGAAIGRLGRAPNLICTHDVQISLNKTKLFRKRAASVCITAAALLSVVFLYQLGQVHKRNTALEKLSAAASSKRLHISTDLADLKIDEIQRKHQDALLLAERYRLLSALLEIQSLTPQGILIKNLSLTGDPKDRTGLMLEGVAMGVHGSGESHLAKYVVDLNSSLMFTKVVIVSQSELENDPLLRRKGATPFRIEGKFVAEPGEDQS